MSTSKQNIVDIIQWVLIISLTIVLICCYIWTHKRIIAEEKYEKANTYIKIYESQNFDWLKKENQRLYDSIKSLQNIESIVEIRYKYRYNTDTVWVDKNIYPTKDSVYYFSNNNDTVKYDLTIKGNDVSWYNLNFTIDDNMTIINSNKDNRNETSIIHSPNVQIEETTMCHRKDKKEKWYHNFAVGPQFGVGVNNKGEFNPYFGVGITYNLIK